MITQPTTLIFSDCLVKRVGEDVGQTDDLKEHPRVAMARFHSAKRQIQKKCRGEGYGVNKKTNDVTADLFGDH